MEKFTTTVRGLLSITLLSLLFTGCLPKQDDVEAVFQTNAATIIKKDYRDIQKKLVLLKEKLDKRNPHLYDKNYEKKIYQLLKEDNIKFFLKYRNNLLTGYKDYLQIAFSKDDVVNRSDFLILGIYYLAHYAYKMDDSYKLLAYEYDKDKLQKLYKNLQLIKWKIKNDKDINNDYLFLTWQNNWQIELKKISNQKDGNITYEDIENLKYIKEGKESIFDHSNLSFEVIFTQMIDDVKSSLEALGEEPKELTIKAFFLFL